MNKSSDAFSILSSNKKLSQLIAQSWLDETRIPLRDKDFLIENGILSTEEAKFYNIVVEENIQGPPYEGSINAVTATISIPYPERPREVSDKALRDWVDSPSDCAPWIPDDTELRILLPVISEFLGLL